MSVLSMCMEITPVSYTHLDVYKRQPYILIAQLYAGNYKWNDEPALNKCTFFAAIDKLQRAKAVDPSVAEEANKLISSYSAYTPEAKDLFMLGYKAGDRITIGGWIGETTTIR